MDSVLVILFKDLYTIYLSDVIFGNGSSHIIVSLMFNRLLVKFGAMSDRCLIGLFSSSGFVEVSFLFILVPRR